MTLPPKRKQKIKKKPTASETSQETFSGSLLRRISRYYDSELLTRKEEYTGLCLKLDRFPTILEWAHACGFTDEDHEFVKSKEHNRIRPCGYETFFKDRQHALEFGVGRGKGRKKISRVKLEDFFDDSEDRFRPRGTPPLNRGPINRGTTTHFIELMLAGREARKVIVIRNMRLVVNIAKRYSAAGVGLEDLVQEGSIGLAKAVNKFEPARGFRFATYASWWVQKAIFCSITNHSRPIRLPAYVHNQLNQIRKVKDSLEGILGESPTDEEIANTIDMDIFKFKRLMRLTGTAISLELPIRTNDEEGSTRLIDEISVPANPPDLESKGFRKDLMSLMKTALNDDEEMVIRGLFGLDGEAPRSPNKVAIQMKQTRSWVISQKTNALKKLRRPRYKGLLWRYRQMVCCQDRSF
eukprot:CAMPEP_0116848842 /NCGR_PEP_ID=MMETSP0418-20121206/15238_1 /TAXON_ID=1158023 /ORGANISM="Astrosyne radiata, Strain 13vi08-1A" /LENGTH=409 /DNA_ID=CAMNT_0004480491 /DNA_START=60 /DNA_END=1286 /DNA_ORIENTATION=+